MMDRTDTAAPMELRDYLAVVKARKWTVILVTVLVVASALGFSYRQTPIYRASARVLVKPINMNPISTVIAPPNLETESEIARSEGVALLVIDEQRLDQTPAQVLGGLSVDSVVQTEVLVISYSSPDPSEAQMIANSFAENYIEFRRQQALDALLPVQQAIKRRIDSARDQLGQIIRGIQTAQSDGDNTLATTLESERNALLARLGVLQQRFADVQPDRTIRAGGGEIIQPANKPSVPFSPNHTRNGAAGVILGLALGLLVAFVRERLDDRFRDRADLVRTMNAPVLATVPKFRKPKRKDSPLLVVTDPQGGASEAFRTLRTGIQFIAAEQGIKSILVTSPSAGEGKSVTSANLGAALAQAGKRVLLVSADLRRPTLEAYFGVPRKKGLSTWLLEGDDDLGGLIQSPGNGLHILPSGPVPHNPAELLSSPRIASLIPALEARFDFVLFDSAPILPVTDTLILASHVGGVLVVVDADSTHRSAGQHAREELERVGTNIIGSVLNGFDPSTSSYSYYYQSSYSGYRTERAAEGAGNGQGVARRESNGSRSKSRFGFRR